MHDHDKKEEEKCMACECPCKKHQKHTCNAEKGETCEMCGSVCDDDGKCECNC
ncbi:MAG: hypothetical protein HYW78_02035 [Parcubacteria group bacterium]|nr:hypothetical protein [Parcubacteria group bacterium]